MSDKPVLSIIVPVYNSEKYLSKCLDSIIAQSLKDFECIVVNDGSSDRSPAICGEYADKDLRVKIINKKNEGVSAARNDGIQAACGEYIAFVDSDDYVFDQIYKKMFGAITSEKADFVCCGYCHMGKNYSLPSKYYGSSQAGIVHALENADLFGPIWNKLYKSKIIKDNNIRFEEGCSFGEDFLFNLNYFLFVENGFCIEDILYYYNGNDISISKKRPNFKYSLNRFINTSQIICKLKETDETRYRNRILAKDFTYTVFLIRNIYIPVLMNRNERIELLSEIKSFYKKNNAVTDFNSFRYAFFYHTFCFLPLTLFDVIICFLFKITYKIRGYS